MHDPFVVEIAQFK